MDFDFVDFFQTPEAHFFERKITEVPIQDCQGVEIIQGGKAIKLKRSNQGETGNSQWKIEGGSEVVNQSAGVWIEQASRLKAAQYANQHLKAKWPDMTPV